VNPTRREFGCALCACAWLAASRSALAQTVLPTKPVQDTAQQPAQQWVAPGYRPPPNSDEKGLWALMDRIERELKSSRFVVRDAGLNAYLHDLTCRLAKDYCPDVRVYLIRTAEFNASMAPNGMMEVWTGLLLRCNDEAQLAAIVGHELGHYLRQHTLARWRDARSKSDFGAFLGLGLAVAGLGAAGMAANMALLASAFSFTRDQEREADAIGMELMSRAGYAPIAASEVWSQIIAEYKAGTAARSRQLFFATHPEPEERMGSLRKAAEARGATAGERHRERYLTQLGPVRGTLVADELALRQYGRTEVVFERLLVQSPEDGTLWYAKGEVYRLRAGPGDIERARDAYGKAVQTTNAPPETYRSIMLVELKGGSRDRAQTALDEYLARKPEATDGESLRMLLAQ
jgi:predicted Zn-dependent protease